MCFKTIEECICYTNFELSKDKESSISKKFDINGLTDAYIKQLYNDRKLKDDNTTKLFHAVYQPLKEAVKEGIGQVTANVEYGTPNFEMLKNLQHNAGIFAIFKNHAMVKEMVGLLKDENGDLKPFNQFRTDALRIDDKYRQTWLKVEYDTAVRTSRMAAQWERIQRTKHLYPNLEYIRSKAAEPAADHLRFVGIRLPADDGFWDIHFPPNRFGCQCSIKQTDAPVTDIPDGLPDVPKQFAFNPGKTGQAFNIKNSDYIKSAATSEIPKLIKAAKAEVNKDIVNDLQYQTLYESKQGGGKVEVHPLAINNSDYNDVLATARSLANSGKKVKVLPDVVDTELRKTLLPVGKIKGNKNPDFLIGGNDVMDLKILNGSTATTVHNALKHCNAQCDNIALMVASDNPIKYDDLVRYIKGKVSYDGYKDFNFIWINYKGKWKFLNRETVLQYKAATKSK